MDLSSTKKGNKTKLVILRTGTTFSKKSFFSNSKIGSVFNVIYSFSSITFSSLIFKISPFSDISTFYIRVQSNLSLI